MGFRFIEGNPEGGDELLQDGDLDDEVLGHGFPLGLVVFEKLMTDRRALGVEDDPQVVRLLGLDELPEGADESVDGVGRKAGGIGEPPDGVIGPVEEGVAVDKEELLVIHARPSPRAGSFRPFALIEEAVELPVRDLLEDRLMLVFHHPADHLLDVRAVEEGCVEGLLGGQELPGLVDEGFHVTGAQALVLGLDKEIRPLVVEPGIVTVKHRRHYTEKEPEKLCKAHEARPGA